MYVTFLGLNVSSWILFSILQNYQSQNLPPIFQLNRFEHIKIIWFETITINMYVVCTFGYVKLGFKNYKTRLTSMQQ